MKIIDRKNSKRFSKKVMVCILTVLLIIPQLGCSSSGTGSNNSNLGVTRNNFILDTICTITVYALDDSGDRYGQLDSENALDAHIDSVIQQCFSQIQLYENKLSATIEGSDVWNINHAKGEPVQVGDWTMAVVKKGLDYCEKSGGAFDITCGTLTSLWDFRGSIESGEPTVPDAAALSEAAKHADYTKVVIDEKNSTVQLLDPEMQLDLGGIAKGYIADRAAVFLEDAHVKSAVVDLGGNIVCINGKSDRQLVDVEHDGLEFAPFNIGIKDPVGSDSIIGSIPLDNKTIVTSGTYERCFEVDGVKYHHILDPKTGYPVDSDVMQVSVISRRNASVDCDALSTTCLALGLEKGMELIKNTEYVEAVFLGTDGQIYCTKDDTEFKKS